MYKQDALCVVSEATGHPICTVNKWFIHSPEGYRVIPAVTKILISTKILNMDEGTAPVEQQGTVPAKPPKRQPGGLAGGLKVF